MKQLVMLIACSLLLSTDAHAQEKPKQPAITIAELNQPTLLGRLGQPLGTAFEVDAEVVSGDSLRQKRCQSRYLLRITHVAGEKLENDITVNFTVPAFASVKLANHTFALYEFKNGKKAGSLNSARIDELEKGCVGKSVRLVVYESGGFSGIPDNLPKDVPIWQRTSFHFSTSLTVLAEREK